MRIAQYHPVAGEFASGVSEAVLGWSDALSAAGAEVRVLHAGQRADRYLPRGIESAAVNHRGQGRTSIPLSFGRAIKGFDLLVLHEGWMIGNVVAALAARRAGVPYVVMAHGVYEPIWMRSLRRPHAMRSRVERWVLEHAYAVHVFFEAEIAHIRAIAPGAETIVAPTGYDLPNERWSGGSDELVWIGRYAVKHKGLDALLAGLARVPTAQRPRLIMRGADYMGGMQELRGIARQLKLQDHVAIDGPVSGAQKRELLRSAAGYIHPSRWECHSMMLLEALALGVPTAASAQIHIAGVLRERNAAIVTELDPEPLARALKGLRTAGAALSGRGRALVAEQFTWPKAVESLFAGLENLRPALPSSAGGHQEPSSQQASRRGKDQLPGVEDWGDRRTPMR